MIVSKGVQKLVFFLMESIAIKLKIVLINKKNSIKEEEKHILFLIIHYKYQIWIEKLLYQLKNTIYNKDSYKSRKFITKISSVQQKKLNEIKVCISW